MKRIVLNIPGEKWPFFKELLGYFDFAEIVEISDDADFEIDEKTKELVLERVRTATEDSFEDWEEASKRFIL